MQDGLSQPEPRQVIPVQSLGYSIHSWVPQSLYPLVREAIAAGPVGTLGTLLSLRVINPFFMWAADNSVGNDHRAYTMFLDEAQDLGIDRMVEAHIAVFQRPALQKIGFRSFAEKNGNGHLARSFSRWSV